MGWVVTPLSQHAEGRGRKISKDSRLAGLYISSSPVNNTWKDTVSKTQLKTKNKEENLKSLVTLGAREMAQRLMAHILLLQRTQVQ